MKHLPIIINPLKLLIVYLFIFVCPLSVHCNADQHYNHFHVFPQAANPGCVLEDFVRWYSPRDYVEEEVVDEGGNTVVKGELSARMKIPGNMWVEAWETARVTPARRQRRLFDDTKEAEKVAFC